ncbi:MAG: DUF2752 domain-containing protein [Chthoniobacterales bacterium]
MRLALVRPTRAAGNPEALGLVVLLGAMVGGALWLGLGLGTPACTLRTFTGIPCLTCGGTRSARALLGGDVGLAFAMNPGVAVALIAAGVFVVYAAAVLAFRLPRLRVRDVGKNSRIVLLVLLALLLGGNWAYLFWRL